MGCIKKVKKRNGLIGTILLLFVITGCSEKNDAAGQNVERFKTEITKLQEENKLLKEENERLKSEITAGTAPSQAPVSQEQAENSPVTDEQAPALIKGQPLVLADIAEYTITKTDFTKKLVPSKPGDFHSYYEAKEPGTTFLAITLKVKNLAGSGKTASKFADMTVKYDNQYEYKTSITLEERGGEDFTYPNITNIEPLKYGTLVFFAEVPDEVQTGNKPLYAEVTIEGKSYKYTIR